MSKSWLGDRSDEAQGQEAATDDDSDHEQNSSQVLEVEQEVGDGERDQRHYAVAEDACHLVEFD